MGIFDFFKSKKSDENSSKIKDVTELSEREAKEILAIIKNCEGGFLNMGGYYSTVWEKYFKNKAWQWNEYEEWSKTFTKLGKFPSRFPIKSNFVPATIEESLNELKVSDLKSMCNENQITPTAKSKKKDLINLLKVVPGTDESPVVAEKLIQINSKFKYELYSLFMRTISFRAKGLYDIKRAEKVGVKKFKIMHVFEEDKEFVELALKKNPNALHPVFPSDMSIKQSVIEF